MSHFTHPCSLFSSKRRHPVYFKIAPPKLPDAEICIDSHLLERAAIRDSTYRVHGFGAENHTIEHDVVYIARDHVLNSIQEFNGCRIAKLVDSWSANLRGCSQLLHEIESWGEPLDGCRTEKPFSLGYHTKWLNPPAKFLPRDWCTLQTALSHSVVEKDKYRVMIFLSTLSYSQHAKQELVQTLLAFATVPVLQIKKPPNYMSFHLSHGFRPDREELVEVTRIWTRLFSSCPEFNLPQFPDENLADTDEHRRAEHQSAVNKHLGYFVDALICQWPEENIRDPVGIDMDTYIFVDKATEAARSCFQSWYRNAKFKEYISETQAILDQLSAKDQTLLGYSFPQPSYHRCPKRSHVKFDDIVERSAPSLSPAHLEKSDSWVCQQDENGGNHDELNSLLIRMLSKSSGHYERR